MLRPAIAPPMPDLRDIETDADIEAVVHAFYRDMEADPVIGPYFAGLDWAAHLPRMVGFWSSVVFQTGAYRGRPFDPHAQMPGLAPAYFAHWLGRFRATVGARFSGPNADLMAARAEQIAGVFQVKLGLWRVLDAKPS